MTEFTMLHGTQRTVDGHLIGVIASERDEDGHGRARLAVRAGGTVDRFSISDGESVELSDGWSIQLIGIQVFPSDAGKATLGLELLPPGVESDHD